MHFSTNTLTNSTSLSLYNKKLYHHTPKIQQHQQQQQQLKSQQNTKSKKQKDNAHPHEHIFEKCVFQNPLSRTKSKKKNGVEKNSRAFCLARTESIPALLLVSPRWGDTAGKIWLL